ncbi:hypothetical protein EB796_017452 [Bugula neritina]|uniref:Uncharacterized protein n=1 Tax=Bugula neritina TaxID=10212 RepID=A0A7J7JDY1_BUGNE|nr:hypothetical protein EB796_017452 [Bugula neritina]
MNLQKGANGTMRLSRRDRTFSSPIKRSQSLNTHHRPRPSLHGNQVPEAIRPIRRSASQPAITDYTAKAMSDSYRLMTTTHSRLSSRDGSLTPPPVGELQARLKRYYQHQPVLGVRQRRLASRRRSVLGIGERKCLSVSHSRSHSDSLISQQHVSTQTEADIAAGQETVYSHHSEYYQAVENGKIYSANQLTRKIEILTNHNSLFDKVGLQGKARNVLETNVVLDSSVMLPDLYPERKEERVKHFRTLRSTSHSRLVNSNSPHVDRYYGYSHGKTIPSLRKHFERPGDKESSITLNSPPPQAVVPTERYHQRTQSLNQMHDHSVQTSHARSQSWHSASQNHYHISKRLPVFAPVYFPSADSVYKPGYITVSASGYGSTRSPIYAAVYAPLYDRIDDVIYATIDEIQPVDVHSGQERRLPIQFPQKGSNGIISAGENYNEHLNS